MSLNKVIEQGRIPFELELKNGDQEGKEFLGFTISVKRNYKPEGEQYYPEDLLYCKAFRNNAKFIDGYFGKGDDIVIEGELRRDDDYENEDGETVKGQMYIYVTAAYFAGGGKKENSETSDAPKSSSKKAPAKSTGAGKKASTPGLNPLSGKKKGPFQ